MEFWRVTAGRFDLIMLIEPMKTLEAASATIPPQKTSLNLFILSPQLSTS